jgi:hypothetical protein
VPLPRSVFGETDNLFGSPLAEPAIIQWSIQCFKSIQLEQFM